MDVTLSAAFNCFLLNYHRLLRKHVVIDGRYRTATIHRVSLKSESIVPYAVWQLAAWEA